MPMNPIERRGLRPVHLNSRSAAKVQISVQPDDVLVVSDDVAGQLTRADGAFKVVDDVPAAVEADERTDSEREADENAELGRRQVAAKRKRRTRRAASEG